MKGLFITLLMVVSTVLHASEMDSTLNRAELLYQHNEFTEASRQYQTVIDSDWTSAALFYNMGNACFKNHDIKSAILYYERAKRLAPNDEDTNWNLQLTRSLIFDKVEAVPELFFITWGKNLRDLFSVRAWAWTSIAFFILTLLTALGFLFFRKLHLKRIAFPVGVVAFMLCIGSLSLGFLQKANVERVDEAIVFVPSVTLKSSPDDSGNNLFILHEGIKVYITDRVGDWCEVRIADGNKGWMRAKELEVI
ncbi:MAG: tetratricopeptide repeat protein [Bacteroidales bacterium]|jgi:tetratricopeptide (TPR) repeat protein|nr:tetratricopeptide repeat protein [Bacteroidales bacterium]